MFRRALVGILFLGITCVSADWIRVGTYNVKNYCMADRLVDGVWRKEYPKPEEEKKALREVIRRVNPDILALQEIGGEAYLRELQKDLRAEGLDYAYGTVMEGEDTVRKTAVLSKIPFERIIKHRDFGGTSVKRGLLEVVFEGEDDLWSLYVVHLKSRLSNDPDDFESRKKRQNEVLSIKGKLKSEGGDRFILVGDFNDGPKSLTIKKLLKNGKRRRFVEMLPAEDSNGEVWTYSSKSWGQYDRIDYIFISEEMEGLVKEKRAFIADAPSSVKASDHRMVYADFNL